MECQLPDITVHYQVFGDGRPLIVLPGWPDDGSVPADYLEPVFDGRLGWRRIYLDLPGRGLTRGEPWITSNDEVLQVILDLIDRIIPDERFVIAGHSAGAYLARAVLARRGGLLDGMLQVVPVIDPDETDDMHPDAVTIDANATVVDRMEAELGHEKAARFARAMVVQNDGHLRSLHGSPPGHRPPGPGLPRTVEPVRVLPRRPATDSVHAAGPVRPRTSGFGGRLPDGSRPDGSLPSSDGCRSGSGGPHPALGTTGSLQCAGP